MWLNFKKKRVFIVQVKLPCVSMYSLGMSVCGGKEVGFQKGFCMFSLLSHIFSFSIGLPTYPLSPSPATPYILFGTTVCTRCMYR